MALFQPTNIIPSSFTVGVVDAAQGIAQISWQVNGNSAMTAYQIDFYNNDTNSTLILGAGTGKITDGIPTGGFYGVDRFGQPKTFTWTAPGNKTWSAYNSAFANGKLFKYKITQYWNEGGEERHIEQIEQNVFIARSTPTIDIQRSDNESFIGTMPFPNGSNLPASIGYFVGVYNQAQGASVREVCWQVATWVNGDVGEILADTGNVDTPTLQYSFNGFFIGNEYAIRCSGQADYQTFGTQDFDSGWRHFIVKIPDDQKQSEYTGNFTVRCLPKENATLLEWESVEVIPATTSPEEFNPPTNQGYVTLPAKKGDTEYAVSWNEKIVVQDGVSKREPLNFSSQWTAAWKGKTSLTHLSDIPVGKNEIRCAAFSPDGKTLVLGGGYTEIIGSHTIESGYAAIFSVENNQIVYKTNIKTPDNISLNYQVRCLAFSPDGKTLIMGGQFGAYQVTIENFVIVDTKELNKNRKPVGYVQSVSFSPDGKTLVVGCDKYYAGEAYVGVFSVDGDQIVYKKDINTPDDYVRDIVFSPSGRTLIVSMDTFRETRVEIYKVDDADITWVSNITDFPDDAKITFNPRGDMLVLSSYQGHNVWIYQFDETAVETGDGNIIKYLCDVVLDSMMYATFFSPSGRNLVISAGGELLVYIVQDFTVTYSSTLVLSADSGLTVLSPDGNTLVMQGWNRAVSYKLSDLSGKLLQIQLSNASMLTVEKSGLQIVTKLDGTSLCNNESTLGATGLAIIITPSSVVVCSYADNTLLATDRVSLNYQQSAISSISICAGDSEAVVYGLAVYKGDGTNILPLYNDFTFEPAWNSSDYSLYMTANFNGNLEGGTGTASGSGFQIYRQEVGSGILAPIATLNSTETTVKDYGICSRKAYTYSLYVYDTNGAFMKSVQNETDISMSFKNYSLLVCDYDSERDIYHVRKQYLFALNLSEGSVSNNNSPTLNANFTAYPTRMPSTQNYTSGTLQGLIGAIYTVPALVEQIGGFKHTAKPSTLDYFDSVDLEKELYDLSTAPYQLFLRDMKGHLRMVATNGPITMTQDLKKRQLSTTISLSWVEIGDASDVTIIQTPDDYGWNNDNQVLDIQLDVDPTTGILSASYPKPYEGTKFYLTGVNKEILGASTPIGVTPTRFELSETATKSADGVIIATAQINNEED